MSLDLFQQEANDRLTAMPPVQNVDPGMFDGFVRGTGLATMKGFAKAGRAIDLLGSIGPILQDTFTSGTEAQDRYFKEHDAVFGRAVDYWTPRSTEIGSAAEVMGTLLSVIPQVITSPSLAVATTQLGTAEDLANVGVTSGKANIVGAIQGAGLGVGIWMPILGQNLWQRALIGGAGFNMVQGVATRAASGVILNDTPAKDMFKAFDGEAMTLDALLGMAFGSLAHLSPQQRAQGKEVWGRIQTWAENLSPGEKAAISTLREGEHLNVDSTPGRPVQAADIQAHVERMRTAIDQLATDQPVAVEDIKAEVTPVRPAESEIVGKTTLSVNGGPEQIRTTYRDGSTWIGDEMLVSASRQVEPRFTPDPERIKEAEATMQTLVDQAQVVRAEEGLPPPPEEAPRVTQSVRRTIEEELARNGRPTEEAAAGAALWDAFYTTMAKRIGMTAAQLWERFPLARITNEPPQGQALKQAMRDVVETKEFKRWFGASTVVDAAGKPLVVYHGTADNITAFDLNHPNRQDSGWLGTGVYLTSSPEVANSYANLKRGGSENVLPLYAKLENPYHATQRDKERFMLISHNQGIEAGRAAADEWTAELKEKGHDGVLLDYTADKVGKANASKEIVVFATTAVKSAIGNRGTFDPRSQNILFQNQRRDTWYTSALGEGISKLNMKAAPAKGWLDALKGLGSKGVKADEVKWSGLEEWLQMQEGRITKEQVQEFLTNNGVKVEEVMLGGKGAPNLADPRIADDVEMVREHGFTPEQSPDDASMLAFNDLENGDMITSEEIASYAHDNPELRPVAEAALRVERYWYGGNRTELMTKYGTYQLPGGENYRELLLTLPGKDDGELPYAFDGVRVAQETEINWIIKSNDGRHTMAVPKTAAATENIAREVAVGIFNQSEADSSGTAERNFQSSHFDQPNVLAHVRFNERTDADGKRVLFIEEFQSDWAQKGKKDGFATQGQNMPEMLARAEYESAGEGSQNWRWRLPDGSGGIQPSREAAERAAADALNQRTRVGIPAAPFVGKTDAWVGLALKRMIAYAAENGFDRVAWTRGEQQVERYTGALRKAVDAVEWKKTPEGVHLVGYKGSDAPVQVDATIRRRAVEALGRNDMLGFDNANEALHAIEASRVDWQERWDVRDQNDITLIEGYLADVTGAREAAKSRKTKVVDTTEREDALSDAIGKAMAEKIISDPNQTGTIEGDGIRIDSTGMAGFYDKIVPKVAGDVLKKLGGGKVNETTIELPTKEPGTANIEIPQAQPGFRRVDDSDGDGLAGMDDFANGSRPAIMEATIVVNGVEQDVQIAVDPNGVHIIGEEFEAAIDLPRGKDQTYSEAVGWVEQAWSSPGFWNAFELINGKFPGADKEGSAQQSFDITPAMKAKVEGGLPLFQKTKGTERGYMSMGEEGRVIGLLDGADASTFVHESGHFFLDTMAEIGRLPDVPAAVRADLDTALTWMGVKDPAKWPEMSLDEKRPYHEKFARGFEQYLRDGEAPSPELKGVFQRFRDWLVELYKSAKSLNVKLNDDIRGVLNRMLADQVSNPSTEAPLAPAARAVPPPPLGEGGEAPAGAEVRLIDQPAIRDTLQRMADDEVGWAQIGGRLLDQSQLGSGKPSFSTWVPKAEWWRDRPDKKMNGPQAQTAVRKALAGEKLKPIEQRIVDHMLEMADERHRGVDRVGGEEEYQALAIDAWDEGFEPSPQNIVDLDLVARANAIDEAYVERAAMKYENDDAAFRGELEMLIHEHETKQAAEIAGRSKAGEQPAPGEKPAAGKKAGPTDLVRNEADLIVEKNPEMPITVGINPDGTPMTMSAREFLDTARAEAELNRQDIKLLEVAAQCLLGVF